MVVAWLAAFLMEFYLDQVHGAPEDLKLMAECTCLVCIFITELYYYKIDQFIDVCNYKLSHGPGFRE